jgi:uncharacterized membrane protein YvlD (DUF360 family)
MATLFLAIAVIFLIGAVIFSWGSFALHPQLLDDAILSICFSILALGFFQVANNGVMQGIIVAAVLFVLR